MVVMRQQFFEFRRFDGFPAHVYWQFDGLDVLFQTLETKQRTMTKKCFCFLFAPEIEFARLCSLAKTTVGF